MTVLATDRFRVRNNIMYLKAALMRNRSSMSVLSKLAKVLSFRNPCQKRSI